MTWLPLVLLSILAGLESSAPPDSSLPVQPTPVDATAAQATRGAVIAVGGGSIPTEVRDRILELSGARQQLLLVIPFASRREGAGERGAAAWRKAGATRVEVISDDLGAATDQIEGASLIWLGGGSQNRLLEELKTRQLFALIQKRNEEGLTIAGSSAGAAILSSPMITGEADLETIRSGKTVVTEALGLCPGFLVDQHFLARRRNNRLISAVLDRPELVGVGIDEGTAAIFRAGTIEVVGSGLVLLYDARKATRESVEEGALHAAREIHLHVMRAGSPIWSLDQKRSP